MQAFPDWPLHFHGFLLLPPLEPGQLVSTPLPHCIPSCRFPLPQELVRLLQQTLRSSQYDKYFTSSRLCEGVPQGSLELLHQKDAQILGLAGQLERLGTEKESQQQEVRTLKQKVGELSEQLGMLLETIQAKDEVIIKLSRQLNEDSVTSSSGPGSPLGPSKDLLELDRLKVSWSLASTSPLLPTVPAIAPAAPRVHIPSLPQTSLPAISLPGV